MPEPRPRPPLRAVVRWALIVLVAAFALIQLIPYGRDHTNPPVTQAARMDPATAQIVAGACADCHSNLTKWPWYASVAPASWFVQSDVDGARKILNFSRWDTAQPPLRELVKVVSSAEMPPRKYRLLHADARLSDAERRRLVAGLARLYATDPPAAIKQIGTKRLADVPPRAPRQGE